MFEKNEDLITIKEMQQLLGIGKNTAYDLIRQNKIKCFRIGRKWKIPKQTLEEYILTESKLKK